MTGIDSVGASAIEVRGIGKSYKGFELKGVSFTVPKGAIMGFVGENGAGKTTTIKMMLNLIKKESGEIKIFGLDHQSSEGEIKKQVGVVFDGSNFQDSMKLNHIAKFMSKVYPDWDIALFDEYCQKFDLPQGKAIKQFSKGMKMKLSIATALAHKPKLLILDEPTSGLDPIVRNDILDIFLDFIQDEEHSIFFSSHITSDIERIADYVTFIHKGQIVFSESKDEILYKYGILKCGKGDFAKIDTSDIISYRQNDFGYEVLVCDREAIKQKYPNMVVDNANIEDMMVFSAKGKTSKGGAK